MTATRDHWSRHLRAWYADAISAIKRTINPHFSPMRFEQIKWQVTARASRKAGICWAAQNRIGLHAAMTEEQALSTFRHELAHLWSFWHEDDEAPVFERHAYGHGPVFKKWARAMGDDGSRCHNYAEVLATKRGTWAHCPCGKEFKKQWRGGSCRLYHCKKCRGFLIPGRLTPQVAFAAEYKKSIASGPATDVTQPNAVRSLKFELDVLKEGGLASSPEAKKIRVQLRKLDPDWRNNG